MEIDIITNRCIISMMEGARDRIIVIRGMIESGRGNDATRILAQRITGHRLIEDLSQG